MKLSEFRLRLTTVAVLFGMRSLDSRIRPNLSANVLTSNCAVWIWNALKFRYHLPPCDSVGSVTRGVAVCADPFYITFVPERFQCLMNSGLRFRMLLVRFLTWTFLNSKMKSLMWMSTWTQTTITDYVVSSHWNRVWFRWCDWWLSWASIL